LGPQRILHELGKQGVDPLPGRTSVYRCLKRHNLIELRRRKKRRDVFRRWERDRPMQLWQMDVMSGVMLEDGTDLKVVTGSTVTAASAWRQDWYDAPPPERSLRCSRKRCFVMGFPTRS
jgi:hypothetical protein